MARIGLEVYELARDEIGELREPAPAGAVSSITMPHKRNPESAEHLDTLARLVRSSSAVLLESMVAMMALIAACTLDPAAKRKAAPAAGSPARPWSCGPPATTCPTCP